MKSNLCDYNDSYVLVSDDITIVGENRAEVSFKNCTPFIKCMSRADGTTIDDTEDLELVMPCIICLNTVRIILAQQVVYGSLK